MYKKTGMLAYIYIFCLVILLLFGVHSLILIYYYFINRKKPDLKPLSVYIETKLPYVTIQLPLYNEKYVAGRLIESVTKLNYPKDRIQVQVLDDSDAECSEIIEKIVNEYCEAGNNFEYIHRDNRQEFKAGALKNGLLTAKGEFIAIFDADFIPHPDFLTDNIHFFTDENIGMVQTKWEHINAQHSMLTRLQDLSLNGHLSIEQFGRNRAGFYMNFNGTSGIWRKETILDSGNWQGDTLAEDLDLSIRAQLRGWKFLLINKPYSKAELPEDINSFRKQQFRWTKGAAETALKLLPAVLKYSSPLKVKLAAVFHLCANIVFPVLLAVALLNIPFAVIGNTVGSYDVFYPIMPVFYTALISSFLFYLISGENGDTPLLKRILVFPLFMAATLGLAVNNTRAVFQALTGKKTEFVRTPKYNSKLKRKVKTAHSAISGFRPALIPEIILALYYAAGIAFSLYFNDIFSIPFQLLFLAGFGSTAFLSIWGTGEDLG